MVERYHERPHVETVEEPNMTREEVTSLEDDQQIGFSWMRAYDSWAIADFDCEYAR